MTPMKVKRLQFLSLSLAIGICGALLFLLAPAFAQPSPPQPLAAHLTAVADKIDPTLQQELSATLPATNHRYIVHLAAAANLRSLENIPQAQERHAAIVQQLQETAVSTQAPLRQQLAQWQVDGVVATYQPLWIVNAIVVTGQAETIWQLAQDPAVASITADNQRPLIPQPTADVAGILSRVTAVTTTLTGQSWGIDRIQAPYVWHALGLDGAGATVGIMDSGVDWQHPALLPNYRGNQGGPVIHQGNWYDAATPTQTVPIDVLGHGTHVAGTAVGQNGIGVAPGAQWIAVNIAEPNGLIYDSAIHLGFQWLLAPNGSPSLAPDVINGSWGGPGWLTTFNSDIAALHAAGILTVFAAGNNGPAAGSLLSPGSLPGVLAVGASDRRDEATWFSSRGPSFMTNEVKPAITAPGAQILSALPGGSYGYANGTSMAAPHVTGAAALLLSANPGLSRTDLTRILTETAVPLSTTIPNLTSGWGLLNVYAAVSAHSPHGWLSGVVRASGAPLPGVVVTITTPAGAPLAFVTDSSGRYTAALRPGTYQLTTAPFGLHPASANNLVIQPGQTTSYDLDLLRPASGILALTAVDATNQAPIAASLTIHNTPISLRLNPGDVSSILLPAGSYLVELSQPGYRLTRAHVIITANQTRNVTARLPRGPRILLVDSGGWYYDSHADLYQQSLDNLNYSYDYRSIDNPYHPPTADDLAVYDTVIWSAPQDSPGYIAINDVITGYLGTGGSMLISGQNLGYFDGVGSLTEVWWSLRLQAQFVNKTAVTQTILGAPGTLYDGLSFSLNGGDSANNQFAVDASRPGATALTDEIFRYANGAAAGLQAEQCRAYNLAYLGFGLEGVSQQADRDAILARSFTFFQTAPSANGVRWLPAAIDDFSPPGAALVYPLTVQNLSETVTDTFSLSASGVPWQTALTEDQVTLGPCDTAVVTLTVTFPATLPKNGVYDWQVTAVSHNVPATQSSLPIHHKVPGDILLVDDDRWYDQETIYRAALTQAGFSFDEWNIGWDGERRGSPPQALLDAYPYVVWYTGYDWFQPISPAENSRLTAYLNQGGRLFLSSQDFLYYHRQTPLARDYLGVLAYQESITPTQVYRGHAALPPGAAGPLPLLFDNFRNNGDGLIANPTAEPFLWHDQGMAAGVAAQGLQTMAGDGQRPYRAIFWAVPLEKTPVEQHADLMNGIIGWLSDLGDSTFEVDRPVGAVGEPRTYTITLRNFAPNQTHQVTLTNTLPAGLALQPGSLTGGASYDSAARQIRWNGTLAGGASHVINYRAAPQGTAVPGLRVDNELEIAYARHDTPFHRVASVWLDAPDLRPSRLDAQVTTNGSTQIVTYNLTVVNAGLAATEAMTAVLRLPNSLIPISSTLAVEGGTASLAHRRVIWQGALAPGDSLTLTLTLTRRLSLSKPEWISAVATISDGLTEPITRGRVSHLPPYRYYFPVIVIRQ
ncbi:MAG: S8 family serine peptidase [Chloroflexi bacterium]|nr:S8 family serine peptidase [Chloroflexota bacterium]